MNDKVPPKVWESLKKINLKRFPRLDEPLAEKSTFKVGGTADLFAEPVDAEEFQALLRFAKDNNLPVFVLGGGANILISDKGVRGLVICTSKLDAFEGGAGQGSSTGKNADAPVAPNSDEASGHGRSIFEIGAGLPVSEASAKAADMGWGGLDFIYSMPGSFGGAVYMNARCYGSEIGDVLESVRYIDAETPDFAIKTLVPEPGQFSYKDTPFMKHAWYVVSAKLRFVKADPEKLWIRMKECQADRAAKGHFLAPCAGSVFKNNHAFGAPSGKIIDGLGLRGYSIGGAKVSDLHANIIINNGGAKASEIRQLMNEIHGRVLTETGFDLEAEVELIGEWD